ncbi:MAG: AIM24 family protein, partial [Archangium sp.]|nr:AIM24 family protein [Archangium sp.]
GLVAVEGAGDYAAQPEASAADPSWQQQQQQHDGLVAVEGSVDSAAQPEASAADSSWQQQHEGLVPVEAPTEAPALSATDPVWEQQQPHDGLVAVDSAAQPEASAADSSWQQQHEGLVPVEAPTDAPGLSATDPAWERQQPHDGLVAVEGAGDYAVQPEASAADPSWQQQQGGLVSEEAAAAPAELSATDPVWENNQPHDGLVAVEAPVDVAIDAGVTHDVSGATATESSEVAPPSTASEMDWSEVSPSHDDRSEPSVATPVEPLPAAIAEVPADPAWVSQPLSEVRLSAASEPKSPEPTMPTYEPRAVEVPHVDVEVPAPAPAAPAEVGAGYAPMGSQRLLELGATTQWVADASTGPFHLGTDGLAVNVNGEMLVRLTNLVAVVGSIELKAETRRVRGRATDQPFGLGAAQLQRATGHGVLYLEPGRSTFHAIDLDDEGAYLREERVFAFEEPIAFDNGRLSDAGQTLDVVHLKGHGRVLLQLDGPLKAMPLPTAAPMVVPLNRLVGWFGRVTPRVVGFVGQGAVELTGEGHALLGAPAERGH